MLEVNIHLAELGVRKQHKKTKAVHPGREPDNHSDPRQSRFRALAISGLVKNQVDAVS